MTRAAKKGADVAVKSPAEEPPLALVQTDAGEYRVEILVGTWDAELIRPGRFKVRFDDGTTTFYRRDGLRPLNEPARRLFKVEGDPVEGDPS